MKILAFDIGGTAVKYGIFEDKREYFGKFNIKNSDFFKKIVEIAEAEKPDKIGVSVCGPFDYENGISLMKHKLEFMYGICLSNGFKNVVSEKDIVYVHDAVSFCVGATEKNKFLENRNFGCVMIGTGLGYCSYHNGTVSVNNNGYPIEELWKRPYKDGICEDYVSATALIRRTNQKYTNVLDMSVSAREGSRELLQVFENAGRDLGEIINRIKDESNINYLLIGGQVAKSFDLFKKGFENACKIEYSVCENPETYALYGVKKCCISGKEKYIKRCEL